MLRESDNLAAEMLLKDMGYEVGVGGTWAASAPLVRAALVAAGIPVAGLVQSDGSGLDRGDRVTCTTLDAVVAHGGPVVSRRGRRAAAGRGVRHARLAGSWISPAPTASGPRPGPLRGSMPSRGRSPPR